ncbi:LOW QUALITY PROTEIN: sodium-coupled neutral amino acid transporter 9 homolog [Acropora millepora]|uniref:LOW QUALITY PROTEIN: sodium-coupled neutral amino acid transporter 9 homolog n=1 Tax=Acropora millepora TaxID=45264 RepID=UPI001CF17B2E|nr:LOW QUALITY PROTEIN: sodium-coupled neutral amino acid transporter 9 homolog [Acropora millepora]
MERSKSDRASVRAEDERKPLLSLQGDPNSYSPDRLSISSSVSSTNLQNQGDSNRCEGQDSKQAPVVDKETKYPSKTRKPFHYNTLKDTLHTSNDQELAAKYNRYRYISKLSGHTVIIPSHILPSNLFLIIPKEKEEKQNSLVTIFSIWNTMMGTSLLSIPWAIDQAGFALALILMVLMAGLCLYSCYLILKSAEDSTKCGEILEFSDVCKKHLGKPGEVIAVLFSLAAIAGTAIVYWVLMSNFLYYSGTYIHESIEHAYSVPSSKNSSTVEVLCPISGHRKGNTSADDLFMADKSNFFKVWDQQKSVPFFLVAVLFPLCCVKSPTFFTKFNSLGTLSVVYVFIFSITKASIWGINMDFSHTPMFKAKFPALTGILTLAYFIHNCILSIMRNQEKPKNNARDLSIAYFLVALTYIAVGFLFFISFPRKKFCIQQVLLDNLPPQDLMTFIARLFLLFQLTTVFPLIVYITRVQFLLYFFKKVYPSFLHVFVLNLVIVACCVLCAVLYPHVGNIIRYVGSLSGLAYNYSLPCVVYMMIQKKKCELTRPSAVFHCLIVVFGIANFLAQFFI